MLQRKRGGQPLKSDSSVSRGVGLDGIASCGRNMCTACIVAAPEEVVQFLSLTGTESMIEQISKRSRKQECVLASCR